MDHGNFQVEWQEDGSATVLGRITARDGSGAATGVAGEGKFLEQADIASITCKVFDMRDTSTPIATPTVTIADAVLDTPVAASEIWTVDAVGYNFIHDLGPANFPGSGRSYRVEYKVTTTGGTVFHGVYQGACRRVLGS